MNTLKINGTTISGIYVDAAVSYNKPAKRVQTFEVPGRNGNLIIDEGTFDNVMITYPVYEKQTFPAEFDDLVNWLASLEGYQRIECSNDPGHYRLGRFVVPQTPTAKRLNRDGYYQLSFDCKPQRWLLSGEEDTEVDANPQETYEGAIATFEATPLDVISDLKLDITPVQNLNGQSSPYPAGGGKNICPKASSGGKNAVTFTADANGIVVASGTASGSGSYKIGDVSLKANTSYTLSGAPSDSMQGVKGLGLYVGGSWVATDFGSGATYTPTSDVTGEVQIRYWYGQSPAGTYKPMVCKSSEPDPTVFAPYENICPISGWTGAEVTRVGKNLFGGDVLAQGIKTAISSATIDTTEKTINFAANAANGKVFSNIPFKENTRYTLVLYGKNSVSNSTETNILVKYTDGTSSSNTIKFTTAGDYSYAVYNTAANKTVKNIGGIWAANNTILKYEQCGIFEGVLTSADFEPYNGNTYNITWQDEAGTVYGGTLDATSGVLTITHQMIDIGAINWVYQSSYAYFYPFSSAYETLSVDMLSSAYKVLSEEKTSSQMASVSNYTIAKASGSNVIYVKNTDYANASDFKTAMSGVQLLIPLMSAQTYQLTPTEVDALLGINNIWGNTGNVFVTVTTPSNFINPGNFPSRPLLRIYGTGTVRINDVYITIAAHTQPYIDIDCEMQECYYEDTNMNEYVTFSTGEYPELEPGNNYVLLGSGITRIDVTPRWWEL